MVDTDAIIVGAGPAGLACAATLSRAGLKTTILEKADTVGAVWRRHYDRLHLHTDRGHSALPGLAMPRSYPRYPSRAQVISYLESYAAHFNLQPSFGHAVRSVRRDGTSWRVDTDTEHYTAPLVVIATGWADFPHAPHWPGQDRYRGEVIHSSGYRNAAPYAGKRVLVVGFGNSGGEIALDLAGAKIEVTMAVRGPVRIVPRDLLGLPILSWAILQNWLPPRVADFLNAPLLRLAVGSTRHLGLQMERKGPLQMIAEDGRIPLLDIGTLARIRDGSIKVRGGIKRFTDDGVTLADGGTEPFDAVILATGFRPDLRPLLPETSGVFDAHGLPLTTGRATTEPGLFFCGHIVVPTGQLREIGIEAKRISRLAAEFLQRRRQTGASP
jgi:cation diffusion facilitator CzcD-associated flavoprotein CzcO